MNLQLKGVGAEPKKLIFLGVVIVAGIYFIWPSGPPTDSSQSSRVKPGAAAVPELPAARSQSRRRGNGREMGNLAEFRPTLKPKKELDRHSLDPTLRLDLLEKLEKVKVEGSGRSLFEYSTQPTPQQLAQVKEVAKIIPKHTAYGPQQPPPTPPKVEPQAPPIPLKFYGFINPAKIGDKRAFFLDGEDIIVATEGQLIKNRYKIVRIRINSATVEDTQFKNGQQTLPLVEEQTG